MPRWLIVVLLLAGPAASGAEENLRFVSDELAVTLRQSQSADSSPVGVLMSGARVEVLESDAASGYAKVRTAEGRTGWMLERYLKPEPIARERLQRAERQLAEAQAALKQLQQDHAKLNDEHARVMAGRPPAAPEELVAENVALRAAVKQYEQEHERITQQYDVERETQNTLVLGGFLVGGGFVLALLVEWLRPRRRRWGEL